MTQVRVAIGALFLFVLTGISVASAQSTAPTIVYLSAMNCPNCRAFEANQLQSFRASLLAQRVQFREIRRSDLRIPLSDSDWPADLKWVEQAGFPVVPTGTPGFIIVQNGKIVAMAMGNRNWNTEILPKVHQLLAEAR